MGIVRSIERRNEPRSAMELSVIVWGVDTKGDRFVQEARASEVSLSGALLSGLDVELRSGDVVGIVYVNKKARFRVIWIRMSDEGRKIQAAIHRIDPDVCPWQELLCEQGVISTSH
jgi:hypothetical protein